MKKRYYFLILGMILAITSKNLILPEKALSFPTTLLSIDGVEEIVLPDWNQISFSQLPPISNSGSTEINGQIRTWQQGQTPDQYLTLGDISDLNPQLFSLDYIFSNSGLTPESVSFQEFPLAGEQTIAHLVDIVPDLGLTLVADIEPIANLVASNCESGLNSATIKQALNSCEPLANLALNATDLSHYTLDLIPNLDLVPLGNFTDWHQQLISQIPSLSYFPLASFPNPVTAMGNSVARIDAIWSSAEARRLRSVSGSDLIGFEHPCTGGNCAYIELDDLEGVGRNVRGEFEGKSWIWGQQEVPGGHGCLASVNGGVEPTGRHPWGSSFKVVVEKPDETTDTVQMALYFRFCSPCGCTPYFIGPVPFVTYPVNSLIFLGASVKETKELAGLPVNLPVSVNPASVVNNSPVEIKVDKLSSILGNQHNYEEISAYFHSNRGQGRLLGKYQFPSFNSQVSQIIKQNKGEEWLKKMETGAEISQEDLFTYFPPLQQDYLAQAQIKSQLAKVASKIDPVTNQLFNGWRLIERTAQIYGFGEAVKIAPSFDNPLAKEILDYGKNIVEQYRSKNANS